MKHNDGIGIKWAKKTLAYGYQADNKNPNVTTAKVWNQKAAVFEVVELSSEKTFKFKGGWRGDMIK